MDTNIASFPSFRHSTDLESNLRAYQAERTKLTAVASSRELDLNIVTQEGDRVTISLDAKAAAFYGSHEQSAMNDAGSSYQKTELTAALYEREMTFTVEGDLNAAEKRDIRKVLKTMDRMLNHFANNQLKPMLAESKRLIGLDSIAEMDAQMSYQQLAINAYQSQAEATFDTLAPDPQQASQSLPENHDTVLQLFKDADDVADSMAETALSTQAPMDRMRSLADQLFNDYRDQLAHLNNLGARLIDRISDRFHQALGE